MTGFPDKRWGVENPRLQAYLVRFSSSRIGSATLKAAAPLDGWLLRRSKGHYTTLGPFATPIMLLTATGAKSGLPRQTPLLYTRDGQSLILVASNFGQEHHPAWSANLIAYPEVVVTMGGQDVPARAELLEGGEAHAAFQLMADQVPTYAAYRDRTDRTLRVFRLTAR